MATKYAFKRKAEFLELIRIADIVITETDIEGLRSRDAQREVLMPRQSHLKDHLTVAQYRSYRLQLIKMYRIDLEALGNYKPLLIQHMITEAVLKEDNLLSLDEFIHSTALTLNKVCMGLETVEEQQEIFRQLDFDQQLIMLKRTLRNLSKFRKQQLELAELYQKERIHKLYMLAKKSAGTYKDLLIYNRNERMAERILELQPNLTHFIAIGAAHLPGEKGVLHLLNEAGRSIEAFHLIEKTK
jgi:hypothetical protein